MHKTATQINTQTYLTWTTNATNISAHIQPIFDPLEPLISSIYACKNSFNSIYPIIIESLV
jgi:hypothetical protein